MAPVATPAGVAPYQFRVSSVYLLIAIEVFIPLFASFDFCYISEKFLILLLIGNGDKKQFIDLKPEREIGEAVGSISLSRTSKIDLTSALINSFAGIA